MDQAEQLRNIVKQNRQINVPMAANVNVGGTNSNAKKCARVITVTSGKGGVGKSNVSINLAVQLKKAGNRVIIFDADFGLANIEVMFGAIPQYSLADMIYQGKSITDIITNGPMDIGFISGGSGIAGLSNLNKVHIEYLLKNLAALDYMADYIIIDTGAGISDSVVEFLVSSDDILLVTTPEPASITDSYSLLKALYRHPKFDGKATRVRMISNKVENAAEGNVLYEKLNAVVSRYLSTIKLEYLGPVVFDSALSKAVMSQTPVSILNPNAKSSQAFEKLTRTLLENGSSENDLKRGMTGFFANLISRRR